LSLAGNTRGAEREFVERSRGIGTVDFVVPPSGVQLPASYSQMGNVIFLEIDTGIGRDHPLGSVS
jgi:hypothetical protein